MKKKFKSKIFLVSLFILSLLSIIFFGYKYFSNNINYIFPHHIADFTDTKKLVGASDNVFVAKINKNLGLAKTNKNDSKIPNTLFETDIIYNIKGNLDGKIIVKQQAGYDKLNNLYINVNTQILEKGNIYILSTIGDNFTIISHENASHLLLSKNNYSENNFLEILNNNEKIQEFREAYKNEIITENGYKISSEKNLYKNLKAKEKQDFENFDYGFVK